MAVDKEKMNELLSQLPEDLQQEVLQFAESLVQKTTNGSRPNGALPIQSLFGIWNSDDPHSADNDRIDTDLAREHASPHETE
jgi:hypothetical protein